MRYPPKSAVLAGLVLAALALPGPARGQKATCGAERWPVKTLADADGIAVSMRADKPTTVAALLAMKAPSRKELLHAESSRFAPFEESVWEIHALLIGFKRETDSDIHIVVAEPENPKRTMIVEIPAAGCTDNSQVSAIFGALQRRFESEFGHPAAKFKTLKEPVPVIVRGVGFYDFVHGQTGVAPNGIELHPVFYIEPEKGAQQ